MRPCRPPFRGLAGLAVVVLSVVAGSAAPAGASHFRNLLPAFGLGALRAELMADFPLGLDDLERMGQARLGLYRARFREDRVLVDGSYSDWARLDNLAREAAMSGVALQPVLINMPLEVYTPPKTDAERIRFGEFAAAAVLRYGPDGSFWASAAVPGCPATVSGTNSSPTSRRSGTFPTQPNTARCLWRRDRPFEQPTLTRGDVRRPRLPRRRSAPRGWPNAFLRDVIAAVGADQFDALALRYRPNAERAVDTLIAGTVQKRSRPTLA